MYYQEGYGWDGICTSDKEERCVDQAGCRTGTPDDDYDDDDARDDDDTDDYAGCKIINDNGDAIDGIEDNSDDCGEDNGGSVFKMFWLKKKLL